MGSNGCLAVDKTCPIDIDDLYELLHREDGVLVDLFKAESIDERKRKLAEPTYPHLPTSRCVSNLRETVPPGGEMCEVQKCDVRLVIDVASPQG